MFVFKKKTLKLAALSVFSLLLTACSNEAVTSNSTGLWDRVIVYNLSQFIIWLSEVFGGNYGVGIIIFTILTRILLLPLMHFQYKSMRATAVLQPEIKKLREIYSARDRETQEKLQSEMSALYKREGVNQYAGCLPLVIQLPIMIALYQAIGRTEILKSGHFLWADLAQPDPYFILPVLAAALTLATSWLSLQMQDNGTASKVTMYLMPIIILFSALSLPSVLSLYWVVGNVFTVLQTLVMNNPFKFKEEQHAIAQAKKQKERALEKAKVSKKKYAKRK